MIGLLTSWRIYWTVFICHHFMRHRPAVVHFVPVSSSIVHPYCWKTKDQTYWNVDLLSCLLQHARQTTLSICIMYSAYIYTYQHSISSRLPTASILLTLTTLSNLKKRPIRKSNLPFTLLFQMSLFPLPGWIKLYLFIMRLRMYTTTRNV